MSRGGRTERAERTEWAERAGQAKLAGVSRGVPWEALRGLVLAPVPSSLARPHEGERAASRATGSGMEFQDYRDYQPGDDLRTVDWHVYARSDRAVVRRFRAEADLPMVLALDVSRSMGIGVPSKRAFGARLVLALAWLGLGVGARVGTVLFADGIVARVPARRGGSQLRRIAALLETAPARRAPSLLAGMGRAARIDPDPKRWIVVSDLCGEDLTRALAAARPRRAEATLVHVLAREDVEPTAGAGAGAGAAGGEPRRVRDADTGQERWVDGAAAGLASYAANLGAWRAEVAGQACRHGWRLVPVISDAPLASFVRGDLVRAGLLVPAR